MSSRVTHRVPKLSSRSSNRVPVDTPLTRRRSRSSESRESKYWDSTGFTTMPACEVVRMSVLPRSDDSAVTTAKKSSRLGLRSLVRPKRALKMPNG